MVDFYRATNYGKREYKQKTSKKYIKKNYWGGRGIVMILKKRGFFKFPKYKILANTYRYRYFLVNYLDLHSVIVLNQCTDLKTKSK